MTAALLLLLACLLAAAQGDSTPTPSPTQTQAPSPELLTADDLVLILEVKSDDENFEYAESNGWNCTDQDHGLIEDSLTYLLSGERRNLRGDRKLCPACAGMPPAHWRWCVATLCRRRLGDDHEAYQGRKQLDRSLQEDQIPDYLQSACDEKKALLFDSFREQSLPGISQGCRDGLVFTTTLEHLYQADLVIYCAV